MAIVRKTDPLRRGLRQIDWRQNIIELLGVRKTDPLRRGLRPTDHLKLGSIVITSVRKTDPLRRGLRLSSFPPYF